MKRSLALVLAVLVLATYGFAQNATGTIDGRVLDASGAAVPGATVTIENTATNVKLTTPTNNEGRFYQRYLLPGTYNVTVEKGGFSKYIQSGLALDIEQTITLAIPMKVGDVATSVEVSANTAQLSTETSTVATTISSKAVLDLPLQGRNPYSLATLVPGVNAGNGGSTPWISGGRNDYNDVTIDGTSVIVPENNVSHLQIGYQPIEDSVSEVSVVTNNLAPEYGRTGGGTINVSTRGGTNQIHSTLFWFNRNNIFNADSYNNIKAGLPASVVRYNQFGGTVGGPIVIPHVYNGKSKTFFFVDYQGTRQPTGVTDTTSVPTDAMKQGIFTGLTNGGSGGGSPVNIYNPFSVSADPSCPASQPLCIRAPFPNNVIPASLINPTAVKMLSFFPEPNSPSTITNTPLQTNNWHTVGESQSPANQLDARIDQNFSEKFRMFARGSNTSSHSTDFNGFGNPGTSQGTGPSLGYSRNITLNAIYTLSPTTILNVNYGFARDYSVRYPFSQGTCPGSIGLPSSLNSVVDNCEFPQVSISGNNAGYTLGQASYTTLYDFPYSHVFRGDITKILGKHTLKMGATWEKLFVNFTQLGSPDGQFSFGSGFTQQNASAGTSTTQGNGLATMLLGLPSNNGSDLQFSYSAASSSTYSGAYFQDDWKFSSKLTLNLGVRYDVDTPRTERYNRLSYWDDSVPSPLQGSVSASATCPNCGNLKGAMMFVGQPGSAFGRHQTPTDLNNWAPRIGFAYNAFKNTVFRGGYGILYAPSVLQAAGTSGSSGTEGFTGGTALNTTLDNGTTFIASLSNPFPNGQSKPLGSSSGAISGTLTDIGGSIGDSFFIDYVNPVIQQWNVNIQQQLKGNWIVQVGYLGSKGQHLPDGESSLTYNQLPDSYLSLGSNLLANVANPFYGIIKNPTSIYAQPTIQARYLLSAYPQYSGVNAFRKPQANSIYHSFIASAEHRYRNGLTMLISFTAGKLEDDASQVVSYEGAAGSKQDFYCRKCEKSVSSQDVPRRLVASANYEIPVGKGRHYLGSMPKALDFALGGWQINGISTFAKGLPLQLSNGGNSANIGAPGIRPTDNGQNPALSGYIVNRLNEYFVQSDFSQTPNYMFGNVGRFLPNVRAPGIHNLDSSLFKNFKPIERATLQLRAEAYNLTNSPTWSSPGTTVNAPSTFGIVTSRGGNRTMQMAVKLIF